MHFLIRKEESLSGGERWLETEKHNLLFNVTKNIFKFRTIRQEIWNIAN